MDMSQMSMVDVAFELMKKKRKEVEFAKLFTEVSEIKGFTPEEADERESLFYTNITMDGRFITLGENRWDLRERHKFENVHIDMNDIYADYQDDEENSSEEDLDEEIEEEEDEGIASEDSYDDE
jgi:DNA-directed RNA polymerase, delta subunit